MENYNDIINSDINISEKKRKLYDYIKKYLKDSDYNEQFSILYVKENSTFEINILKNRRSITFEKFFELYPTRIVTKIVTDIYAQPSYKDKINPATPFRFDVGEDVPPILKEKNRKRFK